MLNKIISIKKIELKSKRYDLTLEKNHWYFANGILVHNCQNLLKEIESYRQQNIEFVVSSKLDGTSGTFALIDDEFHVCSRNLDMKETEFNTYWKVARKNLLEDKMQEYGELKGIKNFAVQGEVIGEGIQGNKYKLKGQDVYLFGAFNIDTQKYFTFEEFQSFVYFSGLNQAPIVSESFELGSFSVDDLLELAEGRSVLNPDSEREGIVFKSKYDIGNIRGTSGGQICFKAISNKFLLKNKD